MCKSYNQSTAVEMEKEFGNRTANLRKLNKNKKAYTPQMTLLFPADWQFVNANVNFLFLFECDYHVECFCALFWKDTTWNDVFLREWHGMLLAISEREAPFLAKWMKW